jgi:hypothetical protein
VTRERAASSVGPGHDRPERARACLLTGGEAVAAAGADYAEYRPRPGETSRHAIESADRPPAPSADSGPAGSPDTADARETAGPALWPALCQAPADGTDVTDLVRRTGWTRTKLDRRRPQYSGAGRAIGVSGGHRPARRPRGRSL